MLNPKQKFTVYASDVSDVNFRLSWAINALRSIWEVMECGDGSVESYVPGLGCVVHSLYGLSDELSSLTGESVQGAGASPSVYSSIEDEFPGMTAERAIDLIKSGLIANGEAG